MEKEPRVRVQGSCEFTEVDFEHSKELLVTADILAVVQQQQQQQHHSAIDFIAVVDRSGSMSGSVINLVKQSLLFVVENLKASDQFGLVTFESGVKVDMHLTKTNATGKALAKKTIEAIQTAGSTNLSDGLFEGLNELKKTPYKNTATSLLLFTDGQPCAGICEEGPLCAELKSRMLKLANRPTIFVFGFGADHNPKLLRSIADEGKGMYYYVENTSTIKNAFAECIGGILSTVAKELVLTVKLVSPGIKIKQIMTNFTVQQSKTSSSIQIGDLYCEEKRNIPLQLWIPACISTDSYVLCELLLNYVDTVSGSNCSSNYTLCISRNKAGNSVVSEENKDLDENRNRILAARAIESATEFGVEGRINQAKQCLQEALQQLRVSISHTSVFTQELERDLEQALSAFSQTSFDHAQQKYLYSLSRQHYNQRSSGISTGAASAYLTSAKKDMIQAVSGQGNKFSVLSNSTTTSTLPTTTKLVPISTTVVASSPVDISSKGPTILDAKKARSQQAPISKELLAKAVRRLMCDWQEIQHTPLANISAQPLEHDFFEWHANLRGPADSVYANVIFHLIMLFPHAYPCDPPKVFFCSYISHKHVYGSWLCLDLLEEASFSSASEVSKPYTGWSSAYSVQSILLQLQSFLFDQANLDRIAVEMARKSSDKFKCDGCTHLAAAAWPPLPVSITTATLTVVPAKQSKTKLVITPIRAGRSAVRLMPGRSPIPSLRPISRAVHNSLVSSVVAPVNSSNSTTNASTSVARPVPAASTSVWGAKRCSVLTKAADQNVDPNTKNVNAPKLNVISNLLPTTTVLSVISINTTPVPKRTIINFEVDLDQMMVKRSGTKAAKIKFGDFEAEVAIESAPVRNSKATGKTTKNNNKVVQECAPGRLMFGELEAEIRRGPTPMNQRRYTTFPIRAQHEQAPELEALLKAEVTANTKLTGLQCSYFAYLSDELIVRVMRMGFVGAERWTVKDLAAISMTCFDLNRVGDDSEVWRGAIQGCYPGVEFATRSIQGWRSSLVADRSLSRQAKLCFHTKASFKDTILGVPISYEINPVTNKIDRMSSTLDLLSIEAFTDGIRRSVWKEPFKFWLPLYVDSDHASRAFLSMQKSIANMCGLSEAAFQPAMVLKVLPVLMNTMVVNVMNGSVHASIKALEGYCCFHRLFIFFVRKYPQLLQQIDQIAIDFCKSEEKRHKNALPSLGEFLPMLTVTEKVNWDQVALPYLQENFDRNALWIIKKYPHLADVSNANSVEQGRLANSLDANLVSLKLLCFHVYFFKNIARPAGLRVDDVAASYDTFYSGPSAQLQETFQKKVKEIQSLSDWNQFFELIGFKPVDTLKLTNMLKQAMRNSLKKGYHYNNSRR